MQIETEEYQLNYGTFHMCSLASKSDCHIKKKKNSHCLSQILLVVYRFLKFSLRKIKWKEINTLQIGLDFHEKLFKGYVKRMLVI